MRGWRSALHPRENATARLFPGGGGQRYTCRGAMDIWGSHEKGYKYLQIIELGGRDKQLVFLTSRAFGAGQRSLRTTLPSLMSMPASGSQMADISPLTHHLKRLADSAGCSSRCPGRIGRIAVVVFIVVVVVDVVVDDDDDDDVVVVAGGGGGAVVVDVVDVDDDDVVVAGGGGGGGGGVCSVVVVVVVVVDVVDVVVDVVDVVVVVVVAAAASLLPIEEDKAQVQEEEQQPPPCTIFGFLTEARATPSVKQCNCLSK